MAVIRYVNADATGNNNGSSWTDAYTDLQSALVAAQTGDEIWVAKGTYKPTSGSDRTATFQLKNGVVLYGGFAGTESDRAQRNFNTNVSDKVRIDNTPMPMGPPMVGPRGYYGYRGGMYGTYPMYQDQTTVSQYKEGTLNIDIVDVSRKQLVWEAVITDTITQKKRDKLDDSIEKYVVAAFKKYPVPAAKR